MMILRFVVLAGVLIAISVYAPVRAANPNVVAQSVPAKMTFGADIAEQKKSDVPRPRPTPGPKDNVPASALDKFDTAEQKKKADPPPRPRPKPGPKDGGEED